MRIVASVCLALAVLFLAGCGTSAEDKKMIEEQGTKITNLEKKVGDIEKMAMEMGKKVDGMDAYLKGKFKDYTLEPKKEEPPKTTEKPTAKKEEPKKETPKKEAPAKTKEPGKTK